MKGEKRCRKPSSKEERGKLLKRCRIFQGQAAVLFGLSFGLAGWMVGWPDGQVLDPLPTTSEGIDQNAHGADLVLVSRAASPRTTVRSYGQESEQREARVGMYRRPMA